MEVLALIPGLFAAVVALRHGPERAFISVYVPVLFFLPDFYRWIAPGLPDPTFSQAAIIPIAGVFILRGSKDWTLSLTDLLVVSFTFSVCYSEYLASGYKDAQNLIVQMLGGFLLPYILAKGMIEPGGLRVAFARRLVLVLFLVSLVATWEFRMGFNLQQTMLGPFFPGQGTGWVTVYRWGFGRVAGPFGHAILAGVVLASGLALQLWLERSGYWERGFRGLPSVGLSKARLLTFGLILGLIMTMSRGPWIGAVLAISVAAIGVSRHRRMAVGVVIAALLFIGIPAAIAAWSYASVGRVNAASSTQETAAYRKELIDKYIEIGMQKSVWGWGLNDWPRVPGMPSIDNCYLLLFLRHGFAALTSFTLILLTVSLRLFQLGMKLPRDDPGAAPLAFTLLGIHIGFAVAVLNVYIGNQVTPLLALLVGWSDSYVLRGAQSSYKSNAVVKARAPLSAHIIA